MAGGVDFTNNFATVRGALTRGMEQNVLRATAFIEGEVKKTVGTGSRSGRTYKVPGTANTTHTASAPGEAPAVMMGNYMNSITHAVRAGTNEIVGTTGTNQKQGMRLEFGFVGTDSKGRRYNQAPRPHFKATYEQNREEIKRILGRELRL